MLPHCAGVYLNPRVYSASDDVGGVNGSSAKAQALQRTMGSLLRHALDQRPTCFAAMSTSEQTERCEGRYRPAALSAYGESRNREVVAYERDGDCAFGVSLLGFSKKRWVRASQAVLLHGFNRGSRVKGFQPVCLGASAVMNSLTGRRQEKERARRPQPSCPYRRSELMAGFPRSLTTSRCRLRTGGSAILQGRSPQSRRLFDRLASG